MKERSNQNLKHEPVPLAIVGGGAAGMFAAAVAAERKVDCLVFERKVRLGAKMLMTANGRCNFTKDISPEEFLRDLGDPVAEWAAPALRNCPPQSIVRGVRSLGVKLRRMPDGRMFPDSGQAATVVHAFGDLLRDEGVPLCVNCPVTGIQPMKNGFIVATRDGRAVVPEDGVRGRRTGLRAPSRAPHRAVPCRTDRT